MMNTRETRAAVRSVLPGAMLWTNKVKDPTVRRIKFYLTPDEVAKVPELEQKIGQKVRVTEHHIYGGMFNAAVTARFTS